MKLFGLTLIITSILALIARVIKEQDDKPNVIISLFIVIILVLVAGLRNNIGEIDGDILESAKEAMDSCPVAAITIE